jgi:SAM-dependent methyltransferase
METVRVTAPAPSERDRFSLIGHAAMELMCPLSRAELATLLDAATLGEGDSVIDLGAGRGDLAAMAVARGAQAVAVDRSEAACELARARRSVEVVCSDAQTYLAAAAPCTLACAVGAIHAFGEGAGGWDRAETELGAHASLVLLADLVATGARAEAAFEVATRAQLDERLDRAVRSVVLDGARVEAYERAWCRAVRAHAEAHPNDPRSEWARGRLAWSEGLGDTWRELAFVAVLLPGQRVRNR